MDRLLGDTDLINRATTERTYGPQDAPVTGTNDFTEFDAVATEFDLRHRDPDKLAAAIEIAALVGAAPPDSTVLDIGAGTGHGLDMGLARPESYRAVDPSQGMLNMLVRKHSAVKDIRPMTAARYLDVHADEQFDTVLALGGAASLLDAETIESLARVAINRSVFTHVLGDDDEAWLPRGVLPADADASRETASRLAKERGGTVSNVGGLQVVVAPAATRS